MNSYGGTQSGTLNWRALLGIGAAIGLIVCFFLPWETYGSLSRSGVDDISGSSYPLLFVLLFGGLATAIAGSVLRALLAASSIITRRALTVLWAVGFAMAAAGVFYYWSLLNSYNSGMAYYTGAHVDLGYGVWVAGAVAIVGLVVAVLDLVTLQNAAWAPAYGAQPYGAQPYAAPGYGPSAQDAWGAPQAPTQVYPSAGAYAAAATAGRLTYVEAGHASTLMVNPGEQLLVGRDAGARLRLSDPKVSRQHAMISRSGNDWVVRDLGATNPTRLIGASGGSGAVVQGEVHVPSGQLLIGDVLITLYPA
jgi:hypothetical protein